MPLLWPVSALLIAAMTYSEKLKDPRWQKKRLKVMEYAKFRCQICGAKHRTLNVHHSYYTRGKEPWQYPDGSLICICEVCHDKIHNKTKPTPIPPAAEEVRRELPPQPPMALGERFAKMRELLGSR